MYVIVVVTIWITAGLASAVYMKRCGHDVHPWIGLGVAFGPFAVPYAIRCHRHCDEWEHAGLSEFLESERRDEQR